MSTAHEKVESLRIPGSINRIEGMLLQIRQQFPNDGVERLDRFSKTLETVKHALGTANSQNTAVSIFQNIASALEAARNDIQRFVEGDPNAVNWERLDENTDLLLRSIPDMGTAFEIGSTALEKIKSVDAASRAALAEITEARSKVGDAFNDLRKDGGELLKRLEDLEIQGKSLSEIAASSVLRGDFAARAEAEKSAARLWTVSTWASAGLTIVLLVYVFISHLLGVVSGATTDFALLGTQTLLTLTLGLIAKWTSRRAGRHLNEEARYHRLAVNMQTIRPFIATLDPNLQSKVISEIAIKMFADPIITESNTEFESSGALDFVKGLLSK